MYKPIFSVIVAAGLLAPGIVLAQTSGSMSNSTAVTPPAKTGTFNGGVMSIKKAAQTGSGAKMVGNGTGGSTGMDTPATTSTGTMGANAGSSGVPQPAQ